MPFYRPIDGTQFCQGDVFDRAPMVFTNESPTAIKKATLPGNREGFEPDAALWTGGGAFSIAAPCDYVRAILLTHDCEIDKPQTKWLTLALVRPLDPSIPEPDKNTIRGNQKFSVFYLPADAGFGELYVDFRRVSVVVTPQVKKLIRIASLSEESRDALMCQYFKYLTRRTIPLPTKDDSGGSPQAQ